MGGKKDKHSRGCKLCYFYARCRKAGIKCHLWTDWMYPMYPREKTIDYGLRVDEGGVYE